MSVLLWAGSLNGSCHLKTKSNVASLAKPFKYFILWSPSQAVEENNDNNEHEENSSPGPQGSPPRRWLSARRPAWWRRSGCRILAHSSRARGPAAPDASWSLTGVNAGQGWIAGRSSEGLRHGREGDIFNQPRVSCPRLPFPCLCHLPASFSLPQLPHLVEFAVINIIKQMGQRTRKNPRNAFNFHQASTSHSHESSASQVTTIPFPIVGKKLPIKTSIMF